MASTSSGPILPSRRCECGPCAPEKAVIGQDFAIHENVRGVGDTHFPHWATPVASPLVVGLLAALASCQSPEGFSLTVTLLGVATGFLLGMVLWFCDRPSGRGDFLDVSDQGSFMGRFFALLSCLFFCLPIVGVILSSLAVLTNWRRKAGWPWLVSRITFVIALFLSGTFAVALLLGY